MCEDKKICGNCAYRDYSQAIFGKVKRPWGVSTEELAPCLLNAVEPDAGCAVVYLAEDGHCRYHLDAFQKSADYIELCELAEEQWAQPAAC